MSIEDIGQIDYQLRYIIVGDIAVGKSCILLQFSSNQFREEHELTIGVEFAIKTLEVNNKFVKLQIWDTAGEEAFQSVTRSYYKGASCAIVVYDITRKQTFEHVTKWINDVRENCKKNVCIILVGNKSDLEESRQVSKEEAENFAKDNDLLFLEASAKDRKNIDDIFNFTCTQIVQDEAALNEERKQNIEASTKLHKEKKGEENNVEVRGCC